VRWLLSPTRERMLIAGIRRIRIAPHRERRPVFQSFDCGGSSTVAVPVLVRGGDFYGGERKACATIGCGATHERAPAPFR
jgi:hypothetical protein